MRRVALLSLPLALLLVACGPSDAEIQIAIALTQTAAAQTAVNDPPPIPTQAVSVTPSHTPFVESESAADNPSVEESASDFARWTAQNAIDAFIANGLEAESVSAMTPGDYGFAPLLGDGLRFLIPSLCSDCGGRVFSFDNPTDLETMKTYYEELAKGSAIFFSWVLTRDNILVQINGDLPEDRAMQYQAALDSME